RVVVVDDGSTGAATEAALAALPPDVRLVRQENTGVAGARNRGLAEAGTPYVIMLDADDRLAPGALSAMRAPLEADPALGFAYGTMEFFGAWTGELRFPPYDPYRLLYRHTIGLTSLARREVFADTGGFDEAFAGFEDWELWVNALAHGWRGRQVDAVTLQYRRHAGGSKLADDRERYRESWRRLRAKHAALYARRAELARESALGPAQRLLHRAFWGPRPVPPAVEGWLHRRLFGSGQ
ncbi:MAG: glycosyl transferase family 2, partial [Solirubrobacterales bacterium]|nr:glycosyl transferase family 2 [Solirubrobacterales bacterium]